MLRLGNMRTNSIFEAKIQAGEAVNVIIPDSTRYLFEIASESVRHISST